MSKISSGIEKDFRKRDTYVQIPVLIVTFKYKSVRQHRIVTGAHIVELTLSTSILLCDLGKCINLPNLDSGFVPTPIAAAVRFK